MVTKSPILVSALSCLLTSWAAAQAPPPGETMTTPPAQRIGRGGMPQFQRPASSRGAEAAPATHQPPPEEKTVVTHHFGARRRRRDPLHRDRRHLRHQGR